MSSGALEFLLVEYIGAITRRLDALQVQGERIMATVQEVEGKLDALTAATDAERAEVQAMFAAMAQQIADLQAAGVPNLDALAARVDDAIARVGQISEPLP